MNNIVKRQNEERQLQRLCAQREMYSSAKKYFYVQLLLNIVIPIILSFTAMGYIEIRPIAAAYGILAVLVNILILERIIKAKREKAAKIQELFDSDVLGLSQSPFKTVTDVTVDEIIENYNAHSKLKSNVEKLINWYPVIVDRLPLHIARLVCQRANCYWDKNLRFKFLGVILGLGIGVTITLLIIGLSLGISFESFILIGMIMLPLFQFCIKQFIENRDSMHRLKELIKYSDGTWQDAISGKSVAEVTEYSRRLQDEIFTCRSKNPLIPDFVYWFFRNKDEEILNKTAEALTKEYLEKNNI